MKAAVKRVIQQITAWSFSRFQDYTKCPALAKYKHVEKRKEPSNAAMDAGSATHKAAELYTIGTNKKLPPVLTKFKKEFAMLAKAKALCEQEWAFNAAWEKVSWFAPDAWLRIKMDAHYLQVAKVRGVNRTTVVVVDHKTGKRRDVEHEEQRSLYALGAMLVYPDAFEVVVQHWYLDTGDVAETRYDADQFNALRQDWLKRVKPMLNDKRFAPRPGNACRWCHYRRENGGPCQY